MRSCRDPRSRAGVVVLDVPKEKRSRAEARAARGMLVDLQARRRDSHGSAFLHVGRRVRDRAIGEIASIVESQR